MTGTTTGRYAELIAHRSKTVIVLVVVLTALVTAGVAVNETEEGDIGRFDVDSEETRAATFVQDNYGQQEGVFSQLVVREGGGDVLTLESMRQSLSLQREVQNRPELRETLQGEGFVGLENVVATAAVFEQTGGPPPTEQPALREQINALDSLDDSEFESLLARVLDPESTVLGDQDPYQFLPSSYTPGETTAESRLTLLIQTDESPDTADPRAAYDAQVTIDKLVEEQFDDAFVFGQGVRDDASSRATGDSFAIITPVALVLILFVLGIAYRDVLDILLAFVGIFGVIAWLGGIMGWLAIPMNVILIAVPFLLIGLSIDYALHIVMRYREARSGRLDEPGSSGAESPARAIRPAMVAGLGSVILAIAAATFSTGVGFFSNIVSPLPAIRDFAVLSAGGILATFVVFGAFVPAAKVELDSLIEGRFGRNRVKPAFGVGRGVANRLLSGIAALASRSPVVVIVVALLLASGGAYGATTIDTEFNQADFLPEDPPGWTSSLPGPLEPGSYTIADDFSYVSSNFGLQGADDRSQILIRGNVTDDTALRAIENAVRTADGRSIAVRPDGRAAIEGPQTVLRDVARENETLAGAIQERDSSGNGLPDSGVTSVYDLLFEIDEESASEVLSREDGEITSARLLVSLKSEESAQQIASDTRALATSIEAGAPAVRAVATGAPVTEAVIQDALLENLIQAFAITLVVILLFLILLFWRQYGQPSLGVVVLAPVVIALAWLLGAMAFLGIPFNSETAVITSLAIGLGVDYSIHAGERFIAERKRQDSLEDALESSITGTGGALLASAGTTAAGFGVLGLALSPPLQRFGLVTGSAIVLAFFASVTLLPCLLVVRERLTHSTGSNR